MELQRLRNYFSSKSIAGSSIHLLLSQVLLSASFLGADYWIAHHHLEIFASWKQLQLLINLVLPLLAFGIPEAYKYYSAKEPGRTHFHFQFTLQALILISLVWMLIAYFLLPPAAAHFFHHKDFRYSAIPLIVLFYSLNMNRVLRYQCINEKKTKEFLLLNFISLAALILAFNIDHWILYNFPIPVRIAFLGMSIAAYFILPLLFLSSCVNSNFLILRDSNTWRNYFKIGFPLYVASFISIIISNIDKAWLSHFYSKDQFAVYAAGALEIPLFAMLSAAFSQSTFPEYVRLLSANLQEEAKELWINITRKVSYITYPILFGCMLFANTIFSAIYGPSLVQGLIIFKTFLLIALWRNNYYGALISASGKSKWISFYSALNLGLVIIGIIIVNKFFSIKELPWVLFMSTTTLATLQLAHEKMLKIYLTKFLVKPFTIAFVTSILLAYFYSPW
jgi:O-antigen/teichoic acid export membrane protein